MNRLYQLISPRANLIERVVYGTTARTKPQAATNDSTSPTNTERVAASTAGSSRTRTNNPPESTPQRIQTRPEGDLNGGGRKSMDKANVRTGCSYLRAEPQGSERSRSGTVAGRRAAGRLELNGVDDFPRVAPGRGVSPFPRGWVGRGTRLFGSRGLSPTKRPVLLITTRLDTISTSLSSFIFFWS